MSTPQESWSQMGKAAFEPMMEFNSITNRLCSEMFRENLKTINQIMQCNAEQLQSISRAKDVEDFMRLQASWTQQTAPSMYQHAQRMLDMFLAGIDEYNKWLEKGIEQFSEKKMFPEKLQTHSKR